MMGFGLVFTLLVIGLVAYLLGWRPEVGRLARPEGGTALEILKERYARGEISREEYEQMRRDLTG